MEVKMKKFDHKKAYPFRVKDDPQVAWGVTHTHSPHHSFTSCTDTHTKWLIFL